MLRGTVRTGCLENFLNVIMWAVSVNAKGRVMFCLTVQEKSILLDGSSCIVRDKQVFFSFVSSCKGYKRL